MAASSTFSSSSCGPSSWVKVCPLGQSPYYWETLSNVVSWSLPPGTSCEWDSCTTAEGERFYRHTSTGSTSWRPQEASGTPPSSRSVPSTGRSSGDLPAYQRPAEGWIFAARNVGGGPPARPRRCTRTPSDASWVEVRSPISPMYYWNIESGRTAVHLPEGARVKWRATAAPAHAHAPCFVSEAAQVGSAAGQVEGAGEDAARPSEEPCADLDGNGSRGWIMVGSAMVVTGLRSEAHFNGQVVEVLDYDNRGQAAVRLAPELGSTRLLLKTRNLVPLRKGAVVELRGAPPDEQHMNGQLATVEGCSELGGCRYLVKVVSDGTDHAVRVSRIVARCRVQGLDLTRTSQWLQWRQEQACTFVDSQGSVRRYAVQLPANFDAGKKDGWPLLFYMHGGGGGTFFSHSKASLSTRGLQFANSQFVVISPVCNWTWQDVPRPWVAELAQTLKAASWVDRKRVYVSGCSMGGMSTVELAAANPGLFAAAASVAGHHDATRTELLAQGLTGIPLLGVHSEDDTTCPLNRQMPLYERLSAHGGSVEVHYAPGVAHGNMFAAAYQDHLDLYEWLLTHRLE